jgi:hypothetical protein
VWFLYFEISSGNYEIFSTFIRFLAFSRNFKAFERCFKCGSYILGLALGTMRSSQLLSGFWHFLAILKHWRGVSSVVPIF